MDYEKNNAIINSFFTEYDTAEDKFSDCIL